MPVPFASRTSAWLTQWQPILPLFLAEFVVWLGFGAFLPVLPLYLTSQGIDFATLGLIVAAWPAARLIAEPVFGWIADRTARKPIMVVALLANAVVIPLPLLASGAAAFVVLRALAGLATAAYDPAARGYLVDATPRERQGEAFGLYGAAQMGGLLFGPALGALFAGLAGNEQVVFLMASVGLGRRGGHPRRYGSGATADRRPHRDPGRGRRGVPRRRPERIGWPRPRATTPHRPSVGRFRWPTGCSSRRS